MQAGDVSSNEQAWNLGMNALGLLPQSFQRFSKYVAMVCSDVFYKNSRRAWRIALQHEAVYVVAQAAASRIVNAHRLIWEGILFHYALDR